MKSAAQSLLFMAALLTPAYAAVDGTVINGTTGKPQPGVAISLVQPGQTGMQTIGSVKTDAAGKFRFDKDGAGGPQLLQARYLGVSYSKMIPPGSPSAGVEVNVFETSSDRAAVKIEDDFILFQPSDQKLSVEEILIVKNPSPKTYNDPGKGTITFYLPPNAQGTPTVSLTNPGGMPINQAAKKTGQANIYSVDAPVKPGETRFEIGYSLPIAQPLVVSGKILNPGVTQLLLPPGLTMQGEKLTLLGQEPQSKLIFYKPEAAEYKAEIQGTPSAQPSQQQQQSADDTGQPKIEEIKPPIYDKNVLGVPAIFWILGMSLGILGLGLVLLFRANKSEPDAPAATTGANASGRTPIQKNVASR